MSIILYITTSHDGYIDGHNGMVDWLPPERSKQKDYGYNDFLTLYR
ncbi:hypothetical protein [Rickettsiales endosymbiont of Stachyamoeba lipophora]|nr:hypothetical protein [Rickettsiales endosymbiont of Stachyamoeba lipophora]